MHLELVVILRNLTVTGLATRSYGQHVTGLFGTIDCSILAKVDIVLSIGRSILIFLITLTSLFHYLKEFILGGNSWHRVTRETRYQVTGLLRILPTIFVRSFTEIKLDQNHL
jgi:hypothetical protein